MWAWFALFIFIFAIGFGIHLGTQGLFLFIAGVVGFVAIFVNLISPFILTDFLSLLAVLASLAYAVYAAIEIALKLYF